MTLLMFVAIAAGLLWRASGRNEEEFWLRTVFLTIAWFWMLAPTLNPWYWTWAIPFLPFAGRRAWAGVSLLVLVYYLRFWLLYQFPDTALPGITENTFDISQEPVAMPNSDSRTKKTAEDSVYHRYAAAANAREEALCCPVEYAADFLSVIPAEILERDYGCGDPTRFVSKGETVVDLGSGGGKLCYILSQVVGRRGRVIGVDCNQEMLGLARKYQSTVAERIGHGNVDFRYGMIQDLQLDLDLLGRELAQHPVSDPAGWLTLRNIEERLRRDQPMVADDSVDCVVSNCVLNLVRQQDRHHLFAEIFRVLKNGGRAAISDIVSDEEVPGHLQENPELWSGCISGAFREDQFLQAFEDAGFHGIEIARRQSEPWRTVEGIEFRSVTVVAYKGKQGPCLERNQAVVYRGPFRKVEDDDGHVYHRGIRTATCDKTYHLLQQSPYTGLFDAIEPRQMIPLAEAVPFDCHRSRIRSPKETKGLTYDATTESIGPCSGPDGACC